MNNKSIYFIEDLSKSDVELLTRLLSLESCIPLSSWLSDQNRLIASFPATLLAPSAFIPRLVMHLPFTAPRAILCQTHRSLNSHLIRRIFMQVTAECTTRVQRLAQCKDLAPELWTYVKRLQIVNSLSMAPDIYRVAFQAQPGDARFHRIESGCEACILARVGGSRQCLADLRSSALGRKRKLRPAPRILPLLEGWIDWTGEGDEIRNESDMMAKKIKKVRREMKAARKCKEEKKGKVINKTQVEQDGNAKELDEDTREGEVLGEEDSIINFYYNLVSTASVHLSNSKRMNQSPTTLPEDDDMIHPAFRATLHCYPGSREYNDTFEEPPLSPPLGQTRKHSQSIYSVDSGFGGSEMTQQMEQSTSLDLKILDIAEKQAQAYRELVGDFESFHEHQEGPFTDPPRNPISEPRNTFTNSVYSFEDGEGQDDEEYKTKGGRLTRWSILFSG